ncbi:hypothetical protein MAP00_008137 [Monascus purpureus]|nr:hypothetical protein MAP00_008137 [Monascus purpureus]
MGQSQSTGSRQDHDDTQTEVDFYELLGVNAEASGEEIKKAYRRKALELHPDRNYGNAEAATKLFSEVQSAYEILSDPQERAWYDSHRDAFSRINGTARGDKSSYNSQTTTASDILKLFSKFTPRMEFSDAPTGFYGGLRETFSRLAHEEKLACQRENLEYTDYPTFGGSNDDFEDIVRPFYATWSDFSTKKTFSWRDAYRYSEAPDRRIRRVMERENKRLREEGIREFNDAVRSLVAFVKKRDPRYKMCTRSEAQRQETLRRSAAAQAARSRASNQAKLREHVVPYWVKSEELENDEQTSSESEMESFECVVCRKNFKSQNQFEAHERSKKHKKAVKQLCWEMKMEDRQLDLEESYEQGNMKGFPGLKERPKQEDCRGQAAASQSEDSDGISKPAIESFTSGIPPVSEPDVLATGISGVKTNTASDNSSPPLQEQRNRAFIPQDDVDYASRDSVEHRFNSELLPIQGDNGDELYTSFQQLSTSELEQGPRMPTLAMGKAKEKRARKAARKAMVQSAELTCLFCHESFPSKNQLFRHLRDLDHARSPFNPSAGRERTRSNR